MKLSAKAKSYICEKIDEVHEMRCDRCMEDCDDCGLPDTMYSLKVALGIEKEDKGE